MREILDSRGTPTLGVSVATRADAFDFYEEIVSKHPLISIGDGLGEDDWDGWKLLTERLGAKVASGRNVSSGS